MRHPGDTTSVAPVRERVHGAPVRLLFIDDNPAFADLVAEYLKREHDDIRVGTEHRGEDALARLDDEPVDCVVSDYQMPDMNGIELLGAVRDDFPELPFILFTGKGSEAVASEAISNGVTDYFEKRGGTDQYAILGNRALNAVERFRARRVSELTHEWYDVLTESLTEVAFVFDDTFEVEYTTPSARVHLGYDPATLTGETLTEYVHPNDRDPFRAATGDVVDGGESRCEPCRHRLRTADDEWHRFDSVVSDRTTSVLGGYLLLARRPMADGRPP